jgi:hypothetical protein
VNCLILPTLIFHDLKIHSKKRSYVYVLRKATGHSPPRRRAIDNIPVADPVFVEIHRKLARWANDAGDLLRFHLPAGAARMRQRDNWEVFYRIACGVSEHVAERLLEFIPSFLDEEQDFDTYLLRSLRTLYREHKLMEKGSHLGSEMIVTELNNDEEAAWFGEYRGKESKGLTREKLSVRLRRYKIKPEQHWHPDIHQDVRGYFYIHPEKPQNSLKRVFEQYLPPEDEQ